LLGGKGFVISIAAGILSLSGCDHTRTTSQSLTIAVEDSRGLPVTDAKVRIKESWESWQCPPGVKESERAFYRDRWKNDAFYRESWESDFVPWHQGSTDAQGKAVLEVVEDALDSTRGSKPPADRDSISNREFLVRFQEPGVEEEVRIMMRPGTVSSGKRFKVRIEEIRKPVYTEGD
jgi:hypothetical protein